jgi:cytochrome c peroxidase
MRVEAETLGLLGLTLALAWCAGCRPSSSDREPPAEEWLRFGKVVLGSPRLTAGIPGEGPLTLAEIRSWLDDEANHEPLDFQLPVGLADAAAQVCIPPDNPLTRAKIELGRQLFFDKRLSGMDTFSCATCHQPEKSYTSYLVMPEVGRNASAVFNRILGNEQFWDGRADSLESQPQSPVENPFEMNSSPERTTAAVAAIEGYFLQFEVIFGEVDFPNICRALASFERGLVTSPSPWDYHRILKELQSPSVGGLSMPSDQVAQIKKLAEEQPLSEAALRGEALFFSNRAGCGNCHTGANLTDEQFHNLGAGMDLLNLDPGRMQVTGSASDSGAFKTPSLRNVARTPPYMHNGQFRELEQVIEFLDQGGHPNDRLSPLIRPLHLTRQEKSDLVEFLHCLTSELPPVETGRLPE